MVSVHRCRGCQIENNGHRHSQNSSRVRVRITSLSRLGYAGSDMCMQQVMQTEREKNTGWGSQHMEEEGRDMELQSTLRLVG